MRRKKLLYNTALAIINQIVTLICGFIVPQMIMVNYGSTTNGLVVSITQYLAFFAMMEMGVGAVVRASLYKPLADGDDYSISAILIAAKKFFSRIGFILSIYSFGLMVYFAFIVDKNIGVIATMILVGAMAFGAISNYLFGIIYQQLLNADQKSYVQLCINSIIIILNTILSVILIKLNASIQTVKLIAGLVFLLRPVLLKLYVKRHYNIDLSIIIEGEPIKQKWNGLAQHIATYVLKHSDTVVLTIFSSLENVSIYYVYHLVTNGLQQLIEILMTGMTALLGDMYAKKEMETLHKTYAAFEWFVHTFVTIVYTLAGILIIPFVKIYTRDVSDADYVVPVFAYLIICANGVYCLRISYSIMVQAAGHFKETQWSAVIEALMNVIVSVILVFKLGLVGVAIGTLVAMTYRTVYFAIYLQKAILYRKLYYFIVHIIVDVISCALIVMASTLFQLSEFSWIAWIFYAIKLFGISLVICLIINIMIYKKDFVQLWQISRRKK